MSKKIVCHDDTLMKQSHSSINRGRPEQLQAAMFTSQEELTAPSAVRYHHHISAKQT